VLSDPKGPWFSGESLRSFPASVVPSVQLRAERDSSLDSSLKENGRGCQHSPAKDTEGLSRSAIFCRFPETAFSGGGATRGRGAPQRMAIERSIRRSSSDQSSEVESGFLERLGGFLAPRVAVEEPFFPEWSDSAEQEKMGGAARAQSISRVYGPSVESLRGAFGAQNWAELEDLLWEVKSKAQLAGKKELVLRTQALSEWVARGANAAIPGALPPQGEILLEDVIERLNHLSWLEDSDSEGPVGA